MPCKTRRSTTIARARRPSRTSAAPAARGTPRSASVETAGPATAATIVPVTTGSTIVLGLSEQPDHAEQDEPDAEHEPGGDTQVVEPSRRREHAAQLARVDRAATVAHRCHDDEAVGLQHRPNRMSTHWLPSG